MSPLIEIRIFRSGDGSLTAHRTRKHNDTADHTVPSVEQSTIDITSGKQALGYGVFEGHPKYRKRRCDETCVVDQASLGCDPMHVQPGSSGTKLRASLVRPIDPMRVR
jgi:hypothetical protein